MLEALYWGLLMTDLVLLAGAMSIVVALIGVVVARLLHLDERLNPYASVAIVAGPHLGIFTSTLRTTSEELKALSGRKSSPGFSGFFPKTGQHRYSHRGWVRSPRNRRSVQFGTYGSGHRIRYNRNSSAQIVMQSMPRD